MLNVITQGSVQEVKYSTEGKENHHDIKKHSLFIVLISEHVHATSAGRSHGHGEAREGIHSTSWTADAAGT